MVGPSKQGNKSMSLYQAVMDTEDDGDNFAAIQEVINAGQWGLQGSFGRTMMAAIEAGNCLLGKERARDYYGNFIPSRDDVKPGTKGSFDFVAERSGAEHAEAMANV
jgi:hypothetical protein